MPLAVVVPTCRPEQFREFEAAWKPHFEKHNVELIVVEDNKETWSKLPGFIPYQSGACRSYGLLQAFKRGFDVINMDDDVRPAEDTDTIGEYLAAFDQKWSVSNYFDIGHTFGLDEYMRGYPFNDRDAASPLLQYGMWDNVPDLDAVTQRSYEESGKPVDGHHSDRRVLSIPTGVAFTGCIMNVAVKHEAIPLLYQFLMGLNRVGYDRWDDIWSGLFSKLICDHLRRPILVNGKASVVHTRASNTQRNFELENPGYHLNEEMWKHLTTEVTLSSNWPLGCYRELARQLKPFWFGRRGDFLIAGIHAWLDAMEEALSWPK